MMQRRQCRFTTIIFFFLFLAVSPVYGANTGRYLAGDWLGYTSTRDVTSIAIGLNYVYFGTWGGVMRYDRFAQRLDRTLTVTDGLPANRVVGLAYDPDILELTVRTIAGNAIYDPANETFFPTSSFPTDRALDWQPIELLEYTLPLGYSAAAERYLTDEHSRNYQIQGAVVDNWGNIWVGTRGLGVWHGREGELDLTPLTNGLAHGNVQAMERLGEKWLFAGPPYDNDPPALTIFDTLQHSWEYIESWYTNGFRSDNVLDMARSGDTVWLATAGGLTRYCESDRQVFRTYTVFNGLLSDMVTAVEPDGDIIWVGTDLGVNALLVPQDSLVRANDKLTHGAYVYDLKKVDDFLWMGTDRGLFRRYDESGSWRPFPRASDILSGRVRAIDADDTAFYFATDRGLAVVWRDGSGVEEYTAGNIFPGSDLYALAVTDRIVWASTLSGLVRFDTRSGDYRVFTEYDGLFDDFVQVIYPDGDYLWLGTNEGVQRFYWNNIYRLD